MNNRELNPELITKAGKIKLLLMDCDGVLTDGRLYFTQNGEEMKVFHVRDGQGIALWHKAGFHSGIITGRGAEKILKVRAAELGMHYLRADSQNKAIDLEIILQDAGVEADEVAYIGDDVGDICLLEKVGFPVAVADAAPEIFHHAVYITYQPGGFGAVREITDLLLGAKAAG